MKRRLPLSGGALLASLLFGSATLGAQSAPAPPQPSPSYPAEFPVEIRTSPRVVRPGDVVQLEITVRDPASGRGVMSFLPTHGQLFHVYIVSEDPAFFVHQHAAHDARGFMRVDTLLPRAGLYRILTQFHPEGGREQFVLSSIVVGGAAKAAPSRAEAAGTSHGIQMRSDPETPRPASKALLFFTLDAADQLEKFEGEWGQALVVSDDLMDVIRVEPFALAPGGPGFPVQFNLYFPRPRSYRVWAQFRIGGETTTASFEVAVKPY